MDSLKKFSQIINVLILYKLLYDYIFTAEKQEEDFNKIIN